MAARKEIENTKKTRKEIQNTKKLVAKHHETSKKPKEKVHLPPPKKEKKYSEQEVKKLIEVMRAKLEMEQRKLRQKESVELRNKIMQKEKEVSLHIEKLSSRLSHIDGYENDLAQKESEIRKKEKSHTTNTQMLLQLKKKHDTDVKRRLSYLHRIEDEFKKKSQVIDDKIKSINNLGLELEYKEKELANKQSSLEKWEAGINSRELSFDKKEKEIEKQLNFLTKKAKELAEREKVVSIRETEYQERSNVLTRKRREFDEEKVAFLKVKDTEQKILDKKLHEREAEVEKRIREKLILLKQKEDNLLKLSQKLDSKEKEIGLADKALDMAMDKFSKDKNDLEDEEFNEYLHKKLFEISKHKDVMKKSEEAFGVPAPKYGQAISLSSMIEQCRSEIKENDFDAAKKTYNQIRLEYYKSPLSDEEKEEFHNTIRSLYDEINLAILNH